MKHGELLEEMVHLAGFPFLLSRLPLDFLDGEDLGEMAQLGLSVEGALDVEACGEAEDHVEGDGEEGDGEVPWDVEGGVEEEEVLLGVVYGCVEGVNEGEGPGLGLTVEFVL